jgi:pimeloyl-ACP methyl ester carboxylesterase
MRLNLRSFGETDDRPPLLVAHGLFGSGRNWTSLARKLATDRRVLAVDMRNHGDSPWDAECGYAAQGADLAETLAAEGADRADVLGHSMGGKAAMALALSEPARVRRLIVADIAPVAYDHGHGDYVAAMRDVELDRVSRRSDVDPMLAEAIPQPALRAFILQNLAVEDGRARWTLNLDALEAGMDELLGFPDAWPRERFDGPTLFLRGGTSDYVSDARLPAVRARFPQAEMVTLEGAGHWLHAERPAPFLEAVERFLAD